MKGVGSQMKGMKKTLGVLACICCISLLWLTACGARTDTNGLQSGESPAGISEAAEEGYILKDSGSTRLKEENVRNLDYRLLYLARNEIFARHGYIFKDEGLQKYFGAKSWYAKNAAFNNEISDIEKDNVNLIERYETARKEPAKSQGLPLGKYARFDLDGDGKPEEIQYSLSEGRDFALTINGVAVHGSGTNLEEGFSIVDLDIMDGVKEIAVQEYGPSEDYRTTFYAYGGGKIIKMGQVQGLSGNYSRLPGDGKVMAQTRFQILQTWFYDDEYRINEQHVLEKVAKPLYLSTFKEQYLTVKKALTLYTAPGSQEAAVRVVPRDKLLLVGSDDKEWCYAATADGVKGWFSVEGFQQVRELGIPADEVFDGLNFAD